MVVAPTVQNIRWGSNLTDVVDIARHPIRDNVTALKPLGSNPLLMYRHSGGGTSGSKDEAWGGVQPEMDALFAYLLHPDRAVHFDIASVESDQVSFDPAFMPRGRRVHYPHTITSYQRAILGARLVLPQYGVDPSRTILIGGSHGAYLNIMQMLFQPVFDGAGQRSERRTRFTSRGWNSRVKGVIAWQLSYPDWRKIASPTGITFTGATASSSPHRITLAAAFARYRFTAGDLVVITSGANPGTYTVASKDNGNGFVTLTSAPGAGVCNGYIATDQTDLSFAPMMFGTRSPGNGADGVPIQAEWDALPYELKAGASPMYWCEQNHLAYVVPSYLISHTEGDGIHPYGNSYTGGSSIHDWRGARDLAAALTAKGKSSTFEQYPNITPWNDGTIPARLYNWMVARLAA